MISPEDITCGRMKYRRKTRTVDVGGVRIGSGYPVSIQSMAKTDTRDVFATVREIKRLESAGCEIARLAVKDIDAARALSLIKEKSAIPIVADIHYDPRLAEEAIKSGVDKIRINPGNMDSGSLREAARAVYAGHVPVRIGLNSGSLMDDATGRSASPGAMVDSALSCADIFREEGVEDIVVSLKSSDVRETVEAYRIISGKCDLPLHIGVTAAGPRETGIVRSSMGVGSLLLDGIGDTVRVSLTGDPVTEVVTAKKILSAAGLRFFGPEIISCPTCGRCGTDIVPVVEELDRRVKEAFSREYIPARLVVAVMGCEVNGPGEAKQADIGVAFGGGGKGVLFRKGRVVGPVRKEDAVEEIMLSLEGLMSEMNDR